MLFSIVAVSAYILTNSAGFLFSTSSSGLFVGFFDDGYSERCKVIPHCSFFFFFKFYFIFKLILISISLEIRRASLVAQSVKNLPAVQETQVQSLGWEDPLEKEMATHSSILAWKILWTEEPGGLQFMGSQRVGHD